MGAPFHLHMSVTAEAERPTAVSEQRNVDQTCRGSVLLAATVRARTEGIDRTDVAGEMRPGQITSLRERRRLLEGICAGGMVTARDTATFSRCKGCWGQDGCNRRQDEGTAQDGFHETPHVDGVPSVEHGRGAVSAPFCKQGFEFDALRTGFTTTPYRSAARSRAQKRAPPLGSAPEVPPTEKTISRCGGRSTPRARAVPARCHPPNRHPGRARPWPATRPLATAAALAAKRG